LDSHSSATLIGPSAEPTAASVGPTSSIRFPKRITYLIDRTGKVARVYEVMDVNSHPEEVLEDLVMLSRER
jgi:peroxiredoxin